MVYQFATHFISNSQATKDDLISFYKVNSDKIQVLHNAVSAYNIAACEVDEDKILYVGRLHVTKGVDTLLRAFGLLAKKYPTKKLYIVGDGPQKKYLEDLVSELNLNNRVLFEGVLAKPDVLKAFKSSYVSVIPSTAEAFGFTVIEAMSMKTCVVGANNTGIKEIILHQDTGLLFETSNPEDLAQKLSKLFDSYTLRDSLAENGYNRFLNNFELDKAVARDIQFIRSIVK